jgi:hypothetical protein
MLCDHPGCTREAILFTSCWLSLYHLVSQYWCPEHAPEGHLLWRVCDLMLKIV